jgi:phage gp29-like protein
MNEQPNKTAISDEIAALNRDPDIFAGYILDNPDPTVLAEGRGKGLKLYDEVDRDPHAGSVLQTRYLAVAGEKWEVQPADESARSKEIAEFVSDALSNCNFGQAVGEMLQAILYGYYPAEVMWRQRDDGKLAIAKIRGKHPRRFAFTLERELRLLTKAAPRDGEALPPQKFLCLTWGDSDNPYGKGLGQRIWWSVWFKKHGIKFWLIFLDKFSMPTPIGKYPSGASKDQKETLLEAIQAIRTETGVTIPEGMAIDLLEAARSGTVSYEQMCDYMDRQVSKAVLGQTLTTEVQGGSYAASQTHNEVRQEIKEADAGMVAELVNETLVRWLVDYNYAGVGLYPTFRYRTEKEQTLKELAERDKILVREIGVEVDPDYWYDTYNLPRPAGGAKVVAPTAAAPMFAEQVPPAQFTPGQQALEDMADAALAADHLAANEELIAQVVESSSSFEEAMERILALHPQLDTTRLQDDLATTLVNARLLGIKEVQDGH